ncbi:hypothetical protein PVAG01_01865 [Phlyctema vagabunda]|uniref:Uncharacterized protein n=1 Tax=Phlyctema vagabunda TaxID=108571 RepID=A0ABR4PYE1_9HELO
MEQFSRTDRGTRGPVGGPAASYTRLLPHVWTVRRGGAVVETRQATSCDDKHVCKQCEELISCVSE